MNDWKSIDCENKYQIHSTGLVKNVKTGRIIKTSKNHKGYVFVRINVNGKRHTYFIHRLVAQAFIPNPDNLPQVNHKDENKLNNCVDNLEWCTATYNINYGTGIKRSREQLRKSIIGRNVTTGEEIVYESMEEASKMLNIPSGRISEICNKTPVKTKVNNKDYYYVRKSYKGYTFCYF